MRILPCTLTVAVMACVLVMSTSADAQRRGRRPRGPEASPVLEAVTSLTCTFPASAAGAWVAGKAKAEVPNDTNTFVLTLTEIDSQGGTAMAAGLGATSEVTVRLVGSNLHFLDIRPIGSLAVTTVFSEESHDARLKAVHSRSDYAGGPGAPMVSQYYGDCAILR